MTGTVPIVPAESSAGVGDWLGSTVIANVCVALGRIVFEHVTSMPDHVPGAVGIPVIWSPTRLRPVGRAPAVRFQLNVAGSPAAVKVWV